MGLGFVDQALPAIQDSSSSTRLFHPDRLQWLGGSPGQTDQQFVFEKMPTRQFRVSYAFRKDRA
jgi:hypothetical protein